MLQTFVKSSEQSKTKSFSNNPHKINLTQKTRVNYENSALNSCIIIFRCQK